MRVDFHIHSTASDGTLTPAELAQRTATFRAVALTDHDNCDGAAEFLASEMHGDAQRFAGVELSIEPGAGFDKFHLLGIGVDPENAAFKSLLARVLAGRNERNAEIVRNFRKRGISMDGIEGYAHGEVLARPHFARWLVDHKLATGIKDAFDRYLLPDSPAETRCYEERFHPAREDAFAAIHGAGGLCVMAHPKFWRRGWKLAGVEFDVAERGLAELKELGLDAVEALYQANSPNEDVQFCMIADRLGYLKTAGSDFHGANKPTIPLGMEVSEDYIAPFLERLIYR